MQMDVYNGYMDICHIRVDAVASSSVFLIGDNESFQMSSFFDTPPESNPMHHLVPLAPLGTTGGLAGIGAGEGEGAGAGAIGAGAGAVGAGAGAGAAGTGAHG